MYPVCTLRRAISPLYPLVHDALAKRHPQALWGGDPAREQVALTFDDGPCLRDTPELLSVLARHGVITTFFVLGEQLRQTPPALLREVHAAGHQVAIHGDRHRPFPLMRAATLRGELDATRDLIAEQCGVAPYTLRDVRPPYGLFTATQLRLLRQWQYRPVMWSVVPPHWAQTVERSIADLVNGTYPGALLVLHEGKASGPPVAEIVDAALPRLLSRGLKFVTIEQMWPGTDGLPQPEEDR